MSKSDTALGGGFGAVIALMTVVRPVFGYGWEGVAALLVMFTVLVVVAIPRLSESRLSWRFPKQRLVLVVRTAYALALLALVAGGGFLSLGLVAMGFAFQAEGALFPLVMALFGLALTMFGYGTSRFYGRRAALEAAAAKGRPIHRKRSLAR